MAYDSIVSIDDVSHRYTRDWAVRNVSFDIDKPGVVGLLGSNGAGKSTTMNIMCGVLTPTEGDVRIQGLSIRDQPLAAKRRIGFLPQQVPLHLDFTVDEYLRYCAGLRGVNHSTAEGAIEEAKGRVGVAHFSKRLIGALSGGYRQRVGIAGAILHKPRIVVFDEPTNGLDPVQILEVRSLIKEIGQECVVFLSTHIMPEVEALCDEIKMIDRGSIVFQGSIDEYMSVVRTNAIIARFENPPSRSRFLAEEAVTHVEEVGSRTFRLVVEADAQQASKRLIDASVTHGWNAIEISLERATLEEAFSSFSRPT